MSKPAEILNFPPRHLGRNTPQATPTFPTRFLEAATRHSPFCLGIDPTPKALGDQPLDSFIAHLTESIIAEGVALTKPQSAYFERFGAQGITQLEKLTKDLRQAGILVLLDVKRGDIASTNAAYAEAYFSANSPLATDAITASPYLGFEDLEPFFTTGYAFVVAASSNSAGIKAPHQQGTPLSDLLNKIAAEPNAGAVIGATRTDLTADTLAPLKNTLILCPGIGTQGATLSDLTHFPNKKNLIPTASRSVLESANFTEKLKQYKDEAAAL